jgi:aspartate carbamoyltransferase catalytic subunit
MDDILSIGALDRADIDALLDLAADIKVNGSRTDEHRGKVAALLFFEPSTRTYLSFASAAQRLGMGVIGFNDPSVTSVAKGESLIDTIKVVETYAEAIVLRHPREGAADEAAAVAQVPVINGGDGGREHPTQTLYDLFTIRERHGRLDELKVGFYGDLRYGRAANSLCLALARYGCDITWIGPEELQPAASVAETARAEARSVRTAEALEETIGDLDVLYVSRPQRERWPAGMTATVPPVTRDTLRFANDSLVVLHPLPRTSELAVDMDADPRAGYFQQVANGVPVRMAVLHTLLSN